MKGKISFKKIFGVMKTTYLSQGPLGSYQLSTKLGKMHSFQGEKIHVAKLQKYTDDIVSIIFLNQNQWADLRQTRHKFILRAKNG